MYFMFYCIFTIDLKKKLFLKKKKEQNINRIYSLFFKEELHFIVNQYNESINKNFLLQSLVYKKINFIRIKKSINKIHYSNFLKNKNLIIYNLFIINLNLMSYEVLTILVEFIFVVSFYAYEYNTQNLKTSALYPINDYFNTLKSNQSRLLNSLNHTQLDTVIHTNFLFIENHCINYDCIIKGNIDSYIHPEIIIRILRKNIQDISLLHILRNILCFFAKIIRFNKKLHLNCIHLFKNKLSNIISLQIDSEILQNCIDLKYNLNKQCIYQDQIINYKKWQTVEFQYFLLSNCKIKELSLKKKTYILYTYKLDYLRYQLSFLFIFRGNIFLAILVYKRLNRFYKRRINMILIYKHFDCKNFPQNKFKYFYLLIQNQNKRLKINLAGYSYSCFIYYLIQHKVIFASTDSIINRLYLLQLCTKNGYPIRKLSWTSINDSQIISQFQKIYEYFLYFYSGIINHIIISYLYHIINDSCLKTLAGKHKTNIKSVIFNYVYQEKINNQLYNQWQKFSRNLLNPLDLIVKMRTWHIDLIQQEILDLKNKK